MRLSISVLSLSLCASFGASISYAQPNIAPPADPAPVVVAPPVPAKPRSGTPQEQIKADLTEFVTNLNTRLAFSSAIRYVYEPCIGYFGANEWSRMWAAQWLQINPPNIAIDKLAGTSATVRVTYYLNSGLRAHDLAFQARFAEPIHETLTLRYSKGASGGATCCQIVTSEKQIDLNAPQPQLLTYAATALAQKTRLSVEPNLILLSPESTLTLSNLDQLGSAVLGFLRDYDEKYAFEPHYIQEALGPYLKSKDIFFAPTTHKSYTFNAHLSGKSLAAVDEVARTVLFYEGENQQPVFRYDGKAAIAFADGHCVLVSPEELKDVIWNVTLPDVITPKG